MTAVKDVCKNGHPLVENNLRVSQNGRKQCVTCVGSKDVMVRLFSRVVKTDSCWIWNGATARGYGYISYHGKAVAVHRLVYKHFKGDIPEGLSVDHLCFTPRCVNPDHMEIVTMAENSRRGMVRYYSFGKDKNGRPLLKFATHCIHGHEYSKKNTYMHRGRKSCRECNRLATIRKRAKVIPKSNRV